MASAIDIGSGRVYLAPSGPNRFCPRRLAVATGLPGVACGRNWSIRCYRTPNPLVWHLLEPEMPLEPVTIRSRFGQCAGQSDGEVAFFDDAADSATGSLIRHFVLLDRGVKLMYEPWGWKGEWYADIVLVERIGHDIVQLTDLYVDVVVEGNGPTYRVIDLDDLANAVARGAIGRDELATALRQLGGFVDGYLHRGKDFPPRCIRPYMLRG